MIVANYVTVRPTMSETHTYEDFYKFLGTKPHMLGVVSRMNTDLSADFLTRSLANIYYNDERKANKFQSIDSMYWEWEIEDNYIKRIPFAEDVVENGANGTEITMKFTERILRSMTSLRLMKVVSSVSLLAVLFVRLIIAGKYRFA